MSMELRWLLTCKGDVAIECRWSESPGNPLDFARRRLGEGGSVPACFCVNGVERNGEKGLDGWFSPPGTGVCFTLVMNPLPHYANAWLDLCGGLAVFDALESLAREGEGRSPDGLTFKWPNDLLWRGRKFGAVFSQTLPSDDVGVELPVLTVCLNLLEHDAFPPALTAKEVVALESVLWEQLDAKKVLEAIVQRLMDYHSNLAMGDLKGVLQSLARREIQGLSKGSAHPLLITMGCPAGVGPEVVVKSLARRPEWLIQGDIHVVGDPNILARAGEIIGVNIPFQKVLPDGTRLPSNTPFSIPLITVTSLEPETVEFGRVTAMTGRSSYLYVRKGIELCMEGKGGALVTAPISKAGLKEAGIDFPGHTEMLAHYSNTRRYAMMLCGSSLRVILVTIHEALRDVPASLTVEKVLNTIEICHHALVKEFGIPSPRIAVAALNPHAGEGGLFGDEEERIIGPAVRRAVERGWDVAGPIPPDTVFYRAAQGEFHAVVCQYHDQGLIPFKLLHFRDGVNVTVGLPFVRTSVDHGTAYDIAGTGKADSASMEAAVELARLMVERRSEVAG